MIKYMKLLIRDLTMALSSLGMPPVGGLLIRVLTQIN